MAVRIKTELAFQVGQDGSLADSIFERDLSQLLDTLDHAVSGIYVLNPSEQNVSIDFGDVTEARLIYIEADSELEVSFGGVAGTVATLLGSGGTFPTGFVGGETFGFTVDGTAVAGTFTSAAQSAQQVVNELNAKAMLAGLGFVPFIVEGGQIRVSGANATLAGAVAVTTIRAIIGFSALVSDAGTNPTVGTAPLSLQRPGDLTGSSVEDVAAYALLTVKTGSVIFTNPSATRTVRARVMIAGDVSDGAAC